MPEVISFLSTRRSVTAKTMEVGKVDPAHLDAILTAGIRVPDHGALKTLETGGHCWRGA